MMENKLTIPKHYKLPNGTDSMETLRVLLTEEEFKGFIKGNILKYLIRHEHKGGKEDLYKAEDYLLRLMKLYEEELCVKKNCNNTEISTEKSPI